MKRPAGKKRRFSQGFSLVELMVAMSVLVLLGFIIAQVTGVTSRSTRLSNQMVDTASQSRLAFGILGADLAALVKRPDIPFEALNAASGSSIAADLLCFVSGVTSVDASGSASPLSNARDVSIVAYQVAVSSDNLGPDHQPRPCLVRAGNALSWTTTGFFGLDPGTGLSLASSHFTSSFFPAALLPLTSDYDLLAQGVIGFVVGFQLYPDNQSATLENGNVIANAQGQIVYSPPVRTVSTYGGTVSATIVDLSRISALVVGLVVIDLDNLRVLNAAQISALGGAFVVPANGSLPVPFWGPTADSPASLPTSVPLPARQALRVFQRFYPVTPFASHP